MYPLPQLESSPAPEEVLREWQSCQLPEEIPNWMITSLIYNSLAREKNARDLYHEVCDLLTANPEQHTFNLCYMLTQVIADFTTAMAQWLDANMYISRYLENPATPQAKVFKARSDEHYNRLTRVTLTIQRELTERANQDGLVLCLRLFAAGDA